MLRHIILDKWKRNMCGEIKNLSFNFSMFVEMKNSCKRESRNFQIRISNILGES